MKRIIAAVVLAFACSCACSNPQAGDAGFDPNYGLPPIGDGGQKLNLGAWESLKQSDPEGYRLVSSLARTFHGQSADFDGDGELDFFVVRHPDGTVERRMELYSPYYPSFIATSFPDGREATSYDLDFNGYMNATIEKDPRTGTTVEQRDLDLDNRFERRRTLVRNDDAGTELVVEERNWDGGAWVELDRYTQKVAKDQGTGDCVGLENFPSYPVFDPSGSELGGDTNVIIIDKGPVACNAAQAAVVRAGFVCALKKLECVERSSSLYGSQIREALSKLRLLVGCNNPCNTKYATTVSPFNRYANGHMNLHADVDSWTPEEACSRILHELGHFADAEQGKKHDDGTDRLYACGRYCNKCLKDPPAGMMAPSDQADCVSCAESDIERLKCGALESVQKGDCPTYPICHLGIGNNQRCPDCEVVIQLDCKGERIGDRERFKCCAACQTTQWTNDVDCAKGAGGSLSNTCNKRPPECP